MKNKLLILFLALSIIPNLYSQNTRIKFEHISLEEGLSQSSVTSILQDYKGFMWFATIDGLNKYDGYTMKIYYNLDEPGALTDNVLTVLYETPEKENSILWVGTAGMGLCKYNKISDDFEAVMKIPGNTNSLSSNTINAIYGDNSILWIGTDNGVNKWNQVDNKWELFFENEIITCIEAVDGFLWIGTEEGLFYIAQTENHEEVVIVKSFEDLLPMVKDFRINTLNSDENNLYIGTNNGFHIFNYKKELLKSYNIKNGLSDNKVTSIVKDFENIVWIGTEKGGLNRFDPENETFYAYKHDPSDINSLSINNILTLFQDKSNILWIGTSLGGIDKWNRAADKLAVFRHNPYDSYSLSSNQVRCIFEDSENTIWIGTVDGGLNKWVQEENRFIHFKHDENNPNSLSNDHVRTIFEDNDGLLWLGTNGGGLDCYDKNTKKFINFNYDMDNEKSLSCNIIWKVLIDSKDRFWIATYGGGLNLFDRKTKTFKAYKSIDTDINTLSNNYLTCMYEDSKGRLWIGTTNGLNQFFPEDETVIRYMNDKTNPKSISNNRIYSIIEDTQGTIWIGTKGGLNKYNSDDNSFSRFTTTTHDFPNNVMMGIINDDKGNLWISTNRGISKFNIADESVRNFDIRDGLQSNEFLAGSFYKNSEGEMFFGGINGFNAFNPANIVDNPNIPSLVITGFQVSNSNIDLDSAISEKKIIYLNYKQTDLTFNFVALDYIFPSKNQYKYMLVGYDKDWIDAKYDRTAKYTNLRPKEYTFKVIGSNNDEVWNEEGTEIRIIIKPAFWQTLAFKIGVVLFIILLAGFIIWLRIRMLHRQKRILEEQVRQRTKQLRERNQEISEKNMVLLDQKKEILEQNEILQQQKEEIEAQRDLIQDQKEIAEKQRDHITEQKSEIEASIHYAKRIQTAALPENEFLDSLFNDYFILFKPRDIVSGDFYWAGKRDNKLIIVAADCTGHGVPGAFMSMLGIRFLDEIVNDNKIIKPDKILNNLRANIIKALHQTGEMFEAKDGMDIALCSIDYQNNILEFAGANNPLYFIRNKEVEIFQANDMPIAIYEKMNDFSQHKINFQKGDCIYIFSDGFPDQFGGPKGKKFMYKRFRQLLVDISDKEMTEQKQILDTTIESWKKHPDPYGNSEFSQIDDIVVIGVRL